MRIKKSIVFWVTLVLFLAGAGAKLFFFQPIFVPQDFVDARQNSINVSQIIVRLSADSLVDLSHIGLLDKQGKTKEALDLVNKAIENNRQARTEAVKLSDYLEVMSKNLPNISPWRAKDLATEALGYEVSLINHLITYNDHLNQLFKTLEDKFNNKGGNVEVQISFLLNRINEEGDSINILNRKFNDTMIKFDKLTSSS